MTQTWVSKALPMGREDAAEKR